MVIPYSLSSASSYINILATYTSIRSVIIDMSIKAKAVEKGEDFLDRMRFNHPTAYAMADKMVNPKMNEDAEINIKSFVMLGFGALIVSAFIPMGLEGLNAADTTNFTTTELALYGVIGVAILISVVMVFINLAT
jgi:hypothetical protein